MSRLLDALRLPIPMRELLHSYRADGEYLQIMQRQERYEKAKARRLFRAALAVQK